MSIEFLIPSPINQYIKTPLNQNILTLENLRKDKDCITDTADKGVALAVMDKTECNTKCEGLLQTTHLLATLQRHISNYSQRTH